MKIKINKLAVGQSFQLVLFYPAKYCFTNTLYSCRTAPGVGIPNTMSEISVWVSFWDLSLAGLIVITSEKFLMLYSWNRNLSYPTNTLFYGRQKKLDRSLIGLVWFGLVWFICSSIQSHM